ncbi:hypothetical protein CEP52_017388 [Fusarium oligoseptatum]|uniref:Uncharacterized protein n=1 Tax=Fusarium oligoseptatum TaxID=2604345 RepID=A0A428RS82_9HYPO|nr:hypothetical protein CEP52_017388 [Fusarium oligoseptatum]
METVKDRVKVCEEVALKMDEDMTLAKRRIEHLQIEAKGVRQTLSKYEKQFDELGIALKNAQEENEKLSNDLKDSKKTTFTKFEMVFSRLGNLANFKKRVATKFEMIFSRLGSQGKESGGGDVDGGDARE